MATIISIRQQLEAALHDWLVASFEGKTEFTGVTFAKGQRSDAIAMPTVTAACADAQEEEVPGLGIFRITGALVVMTTIDDETTGISTTAEAQHRARADVIANKTEDLDGLKSFLNNSGRVFVFGFGVAKSEHSVVDRHFVDRFELDIHCRCV